MNLLATSGGFSGNFLRYFLIIIPTFELNFIFYSSITFKLLNYNYNYNNLLKR